MEPPRKYNDTRYIVDTDEDKRQTGLGYHSNEDTDMLNDIDDEMQMVKMCKVIIIVENESNEDMEVSDRNFVELKQKFQKTSH